METSIRIYRWSDSVFAVSSTRHPDTRDAATGFANTKSMMDYPLRRTHVGTELLLRHRSPHPFVHSNSALPRRIDLEKPQARCLELKSPSIMTGQVDCLCIIAPK